MSKKNPISILYEDESLIVLHKPSGILTVPDRWDPKKPNLDQWLKERIPTSSVVHRLDLETSGVILFAKTSEAHRALSLQFQNRRVTKTYWALVSGTPEKVSAKIDLPIAEDLKVLGKMRIHRSGKASQSEYRIVERFRRFSVLHVSPKTGRHHQVRLHLSAIGHPLAVDALYEGRKALYLSEFKRNYRGENEERPLLSRISLHALRIEFFHPETDEKVLFEADLPKDLAVALKQIKKWNQLSTQNY